MAVDRQRECLAAEEPSVVGDRQVDRLRAAEDRPTAAEDRPSAAEDCPTVD